MLQNTEDVHEPPERLHSVLKFRIAKYRFSFSLAAGPSTYEYTYTYRDSNHEHPARQVRARTQAKALKYFCTFISELPK